MNLLTQEVMALKASLDALKNSPAPIAPIGFPVVPGGPNVNPAGLNPVAVGNQLYVGGQPVAVRDRTVTDLNGINRGPVGRISLAVHPPVPVIERLRKEAAAALAAKEPAAPAPAAAPAVDFSGDRGPLGKLRPIPIELPSPQLLLSKLNGGPTLAVAPAPAPAAVDLPPPRAFNSSDRGPVGKLNLTALLPPQPLPLLSVQNVQLGGAAIVAAVPAPPVKVLDPNADRGPVGKLKLTPVLASPTATILNINPSVVAPIAELPAPTPKVLNLNGDRGPVGKLNLSAIAAPAAPPAAVAVQAVAAAAAAERTRVLRRRMLRGDRGPVGKLQIGVIPTSADGQSLMLPAPNVPQGVPQSVVMDAETLARRMFQQWVADVQARATGIHSQLVNGPAAVPPIPTTA